MSPSLAPLRKWETTEVAKGTSAALKRKPRLAQLSGTSIALRRVNDVRCPTQSTARFKNEIVYARYAGHSSSSPERR